MYAQAEVPLIPSPFVPTDALAVWSTANTASLQNDSAYTFLYDLTVGQHAITAVYLGDNNNLASTSDALTQVRGPTLPVAVRPSVGSGHGTAPIIHTPFGAPSLEKGLPQPRSTLAACKDPTKLGQEVCVAAAAA